MVVSFNDWSGTSVKSKKCKMCKLNVPEEYMKGEFCIPCDNLKIIYGMGAYFSKLFPFAILLAGLIWFFAPEYRYFLIPILVLIVGPTFLVGLFQLKIHMRGVPDELKTVPIIRGYHFNPSFDYYDGALTTWQKHGSDSSPEMKKAVFKNLLKYIVLNDSPTPYGWVRQWAEASGLSEKEFVEFLLENLPKEFEEALKPKIGYGVIPELWNGIKELDIEQQKKIYDIILKYVEDLDSYNGFERKVFAEELFVIEDELIPRLKEIDGQKYSPIIELIDAFTPDPVPKNRLEAMMKASEIQAQMSKLAKK